MSHPARRILLVISSLSGGGAERVAVLMARGFLGRGHQVSLVTVFGRDSDFYDLPRSVKRVALNLGRDRSTVVQKITGNYQRVRALRRTMLQERPDVVISFMSQTNVLTLLASRGLGIPVIITEHIEASRFPLPFRWEWLRRRTYHWATRLVSVSEAVDVHFRWIPHSQRTIICNAIPLAELRQESGRPLRQDWPHIVLAMGRLTDQKGFDILIRAFAKIAAELPDWGLVILGEGEDRLMLDELVQQLGLRDRVRLPGVLHQPYAAMKQSDLFVLSSRHEGFGIVLVEAMACGLPVIATDCWSVSPGIVHDGMDGRLVPVEDVSGLAATMSELMQNEERRKQLGHAAAESARRFDLDTVMGQWQNLLDVLLPANP